MDRVAIAGKLRQQLQDYLQGKGLDLVEIICRYEAGGLFLRMLVDWPEGGITLHDCAELNKEIGVLLSELNILEQGYTLEVSSPGLDRPLKTENDFRRSKSKLVKFFLNQPINAKLEWDGVIDNVNAGAVYIKTGDKLMQVPLSKINKAKQLFLKEE